jgi:hypothetical protein
VRIKRQQQLLVQLAEREGGIAGTILQLRIKASAREAPLKG